jgi:hypothetical protein
MFKDEYYNTSLYDYEDADWEEEWRAFMADEDPVTWPLEDDLS